MNDDNPAQKILKVASALFYEHGVHAVGVDRLIAESGVAKATFYRHFPSKDALVRETLRLRDVSVRGWMQRAAEKRVQAEGGSLALALFDVLGDWFATPGFNGCPFVRSAFEEPNNAAIRDLAENHKAKTQDWIAATLAAEGHADTQGLAERLMLLFDGAIVQAFVRRDPTVARTARAAAAALIGAKS